MNITNQRICAWGAPVGVALTFSGLILAGLFPPTPPSWDAGRMTAIYLEHAITVRLGCILMLAALIPLAAFIAGLTVQMKRIEGADSPMAYTQLGSGMLGLIPFILSPTMWCAAAFRPERSPEILLILNDLSWFFFIMTAAPFILQVLAFGFAVISDKRRETVFPRWSAFLSFWVAILSLPGMVISLFHSGPFAWNGLFAFWLAATIFGVWLLVVFVLLLKAITRQAASEPVG